MINDIWLNLPVKDVKKSKAFFQAIGFALNEGPGNTEVSASFLVGSRNFVVMLFEEKVFESFTKFKTSDLKQGTEVLISVGAESPAEVDELQRKVLAAGGSMFAEAGGAHGMYGCGFTDLDGHRWNALYMGS